MRMHVRIPVPGSNIELEGLVGSAPVRAVIAPPHPLYGGHLSNPVVTALRNGLARRGIGALAFNWRGVGASDGRPSDDADIAAADYASALAYVKAAAPHPLPWVAAGYSFGAATALAVAASDDSVREVVVVAPPVTLLPRGLSLAAAECRVTVIAASDDEFAPLHCYSPILVLLDDHTELELVLCTPSPSLLHQAGLEPAGESSQPPFLWRFL